MKTPIVLGSLLALAGAASTAESADAAISSEAYTKDALQEAICFQDWYKAIELSSKLITSSTISPDYRQTLLDWRHQFYSYAGGGAKSSEEFPSCEGDSSIPTKDKAPVHPGPAPQFSSRSTTYSSPVAAAVISPDQTSPFNDNVWTVGTRIEGNRIRGTILNNGWIDINNASLTIRSQQNDRTEVIRTVALDKIKAWDETNFVATFNPAPGNWTIESIDVN